MSFAGVGVLEVCLDGKTIYSYQAEHRMPTRGEVAERIRAARLP
jgi:hypothetical protein